MKTLDLNKEFKQLYQPSAKKAEIVQVPPLQFAMIDGAIEKGSEPGKSPMFAEAAQCIGRERKHHEIYLSDPRKADPAKLKTVLRHPIERI